jgi:hypothetical protein
VVGEFLNIDTDQGLYTNFQHNYREWVPAWNTVHRTTHARKGYSPKLAEGMFCEIQTTWGDAPHRTGWHCMSEPSRSSFMARVVSSLPRFLPLA